MSEKNLSEEKKVKVRKGSVAISICFVIALIIVMIYIFLPENSVIVEEVPEKQPNIKILVRNGCGISDLAQRVSQALLYNKITVVDWENIPNQSCVYDETRIVVRCERNEEVEYKLKYLQDKTGIINVTNAVKANAKAEFELILGKDYVLYF
jgi:LytR cell envelope-related transcriptional attenuator